MGYLERGCKLWFAFSKKAAIDLLFRTAPPFTSFPRFSALM
jgi:hypothetical protein